MAAVVPGQREWKGGRDGSGHYNLEVTHLVQCGPGEGPYKALTAAGLPLPGERWRFNVDQTTGVAGEEMVWAYCGLESNAEPDYSEGEPGEYWHVTQPFSTKPPERTEPAGDPLLEPQKVTGTFSKSSKESTNDRFGRPITNSAWERFRGQQVEFDGGYAVVNIEQNVAVLDLPALVLAYQTLNNLPLWGMPPRTIKLSNISWEPHDYTRTDPTTGAPVPSRYYTRKFEFEANWEGWDRDLLDESNKVLHGRWKRGTTTTTTTVPATTTAPGATTTQGATTTTAPPTVPGQEPLVWELLPVDGGTTMPDPNNPTHFIRFTDPWGNVSKGILNGAGIPAGSVAPTGRKYVSLQAANFGHRLWEKDWWVRAANDPTYFSQHYLGRYWPRGTLVIDEASGGKYIALNDVPAYTTPPPALTNAAYWRALPTGTNNAGYYGLTTTYGLGDYVEDNLEIGAGYRHVEKYNETDFATVLGIPITF